MNGWVDRWVDGGDVQTGEESLLWGACDLRNVTERNDTHPTAAVTAMPTVLGAGSLTLWLLGTLNTDRSQTSGRLRAVPAGVCQARLQAEATRGGAL